MFTYFKNYYMPFSIHHIEKTLNFSIHMRNFLDNPKQNKQRAEPFYLLVVWLYAYGDFVLCHLHGLELMDLLILPQLHVAFQPVMIIYYVYAYNDNNYNYL